MPQYLTYHGPPQQHTVPAGDVVLYEKQSSGQFIGPMLWLELDAKVGQPPTQPLGLCVNRRLRANAQLLSTNRAYVDAGRIWVLYQGNVPFNNTDPV